METLAPTKTTVTEVDTSKHCVFRCGESWYSVPAVAVREIVVPPDLVHLPFCPPSLLGLCHLRNEFIPVVSLTALLDYEAAADRVGTERLLVFEGRSAWSLLISDSATLESVETSVAQESRSGDTLLGTAMFRDKIVRVLHPGRLHSKVQQILEKHWSPNHQA